MRSIDWKLGSGDQVETIFKTGNAGLSMKPLNRIPPALPGGVVYFEIVRHPEFWKDVVRTATLGLRFKLERGRFLSAQMLALTSPTTRELREPPVRRVRRQEPLNPLLQGPGRQ